MEKKKYKITYLKDECIGAFACVDAESKTWKKVGDKADIINPDSKDENEVYIKYVDNLENNLEAAQSCPVNCIHIEECATGKKLI